MKLVTALTIAGICLMFFSYITQGGGQAESAIIDRVAKKLSIDHRSDLLQIGDSYYYRNGQFICFDIKKDHGGDKMCDIILQADVSTFHPLRADPSGMYAVDSAAVYFRGMSLKDANPKTFKYIGFCNFGNYSTDGEHIYFNDRIAQRPDLLRLVSSSKLSSVWCVQGDH